MVGSGASAGPAVQRPYVMQSRDTTITDIWFQSPLSLEQIAAELGLSGVRPGFENYWEWVIGTVSGSGGACLRAAKSRSSSPALQR